MFKDVITSRKLSGNLLRKNNTRLIFLRFLLIFYHFSLLSDCKNLLPVSSEVKSEDASYNELNAKIQRLEQEKNEIAEKLRGMKLEVHLQQLSAILFFTVLVI